MSPLSEEPRPPTDPARTVDDLERKVLGREPEDARIDDADPDDPAFDQDLDVEDLPGGAGEPGGHVDEPTD